MRYNVITGTPVVGKCSVAWVCKLYDRVLAASFLVFVRGSRCSFLLCLIVSIRSRDNAWVQVRVIELIGRAILTVCTATDDVPLMGCICCFNRCLCLTVPLPDGVSRFGKLKRITVTVQ